MKRRVKKSPKGRRVVIYKPGKPAGAVCAICDARLNAVPKRDPTAMRKLAKTEKRPERIFGGVLCHACVEQLIKERIRLQSGDLQKEDVDLLHLKYLERMKG